MESDISVCSAKKIGMADVCDANDIGYFEVNGYIEGTIC